MIITEKSNPVRIEHPVKRLVRRVKESVKPTHCSVRFDSDLKAWAVINDKQEPTHHFEYGVMKNVVFSSVRNPHVQGCGPSEYIGIAEGDLVENTYGTDAIGFKNLSFQAGHFVDATGSEIQTASVLRLFSNRSSLYKE